MNRPSGLNATPLTLSACPSSRCNSRPLPASHNRTVLSELPVASVRLSGPNATQDTSSVCPCSRSSSWPLLTSQSTIAFSTLSASRPFPS